MIVNSSKMNFADVVNDILRNDYLPEVAEAVSVVIPKVGREAAQKLRKESPKRPNGGKYAQGWKCKVEKGRMNVGATVYGESGTYQLAHLLEKGHAKRTGGRVQPVVHIAPVEEWATQKAYDDIMDRLEKV